MPSKTLGKRERNKEAVRTQLISEATKLFRTKGFENTTVSDIVNACQIGRGTYYNYFSDVKDIFYYVVQNLNARVRELTFEARKTAKTPYEFFYNSFLSYFNYASSKEMLRFHQLNKGYIREASYKSESIKNIINDLQQELNVFIEAGQFKTDTDLKLLSYVLIDTPVELFMNSLSVSDKFKNEQVAEFLAKLFTKGIDIQTNKK